MENAILPQSPVPSSTSPHSLHHSTPISLPHNTLHRSCQIHTLQLRNPILITWSTLCNPPIILGSPSESPMRITFRLSYIQNEHTAMQSKYHYCPSSFCIHYFYPERPYIVPYSHITLCLKTPTRDMQRCPTTSETWNMRRLNIQHR